MIFDNSITNGRCLKLYKIFSIGLCFSNLKLLPNVFYLIFYICSKGMTNSLEQVKDELIR